MPQLNYFPHVLHGRILLIRGAFHAIRILIFFGNVLHYSQCQGEFLIHYQPFDCFSHIRKLTLIFDFFTNIVIVRAQYVDFFSINALLYLITFVLCIFSRLDILSFSMTYPDSISCFLLNLLDRMFWLIFLLQCPRLIIFSVLLFNFMSYFCLYTGSVIISATQNGLARQFSPSGSSTTYFKLCWKYPK